MQFKTDASETNGQDIVSAINDFCDSNVDSYPIASKVRNANVGYETLIGKILEVDGDWQWDDTNYTNLPRGTGNLVDGQETYSFTSEYLNIQMIEILNKNSPARYYKIDPIDSLDLRMSPEEYFGLESDGSPKKGLPLYYDKVGDTVILYPTPDTDDVTLTDGIRIWFQRTADLFTTTDTTQEPGLPSPYHILIVYYASIPYCQKYKKDMVPWLERKWVEGVADMLKHFGKREKDKRKIMSMAPINYF